MQKTLMEMLIEAGYPKEEMDHHDSDLYVYVTPLTTKVIEEWCKAHDYRMAWHCPTFRDQITGKMMYDCAFQWYENQQEIVISGGEDMQATITRNGKRYRLSTAEMLEAARCLRINFMQDELESQFNVPESKSEELAIKADELYCEGNVDRTEYDCINEIANNYGY